MPQILQRFDTGRNDIEWSDIDDMLNNSIAPLRTGDNLLDISNLKMNIAQYASNNDILDLFRDYDVKMLSRTGTGRNDIEYDDIIDFRNLFYPGCVLDSNGNADGVQISLWLYIYYDGIYYTGYNNEFAGYGSATIESVDKTSFTFTEDKLIYSSNISTGKYSYPYVYLTIRRHFSGNQYDTLSKRSIFQMMALRYKYIYIGNIRYDVDYGLNGSVAAIILTNQVGEIIPNVTTFRTIRFSNT